ncbi:hypothetical protein WNZ14_10220 [Hoeflea sp. AS60]|uniref:hypothetical protein n=1 Tax=Hoeflea sp. AS60 TaxID=3135780 RepID=UPI003172589B
MNVAIAGFGAYAARQLVTIYARHIQITDDNLRVRLVQQLKCPLAIGRLNGQITQILQDARNERTLNSVVVDYHYIHQKPSTLYT